ncbi:hypothetical protein ACROYT_G015659 [Oculina patagonica]
MLNTGSWMSEVLSLKHLVLKRMASRKRFKNWRYGLFYFLATDEVGMAKTSIIMEGYKSVEKGKYVKLLWPSDGVVYNASGRTCDGCGTEKLSLMPEEQCREESGLKVKWQRFEYITNDETGQRKLFLSSKETSPEEMFVFTGLLPGTSVSC